MTSVSHGRHGARAARDAGRREHPIRAHAAFGTQPTVCTPSRVNAAVTWPALWSRGLPRNNLPTAPALRMPQIDTRKSARSSEPTTPGDSPLSLDSTLRDWLSETLSECCCAVLGAPHPVRARESMRHSLPANLGGHISNAEETSNNPKVYVKLLVSNGAAGSIIGKVAWSRTRSGSWAHDGAPCSHGGCRAGIGRTCCPASVRFEHSNRHAHL